MSRTQGTGQFAIASDLVYGGPGNDLIDGGSGNGTINGNDQNDQLYGNNPNDAIDGGFGTDNGNTGTNTLTNCNPYPQRIVTTPGEVTTRSIRSGWGCQHPQRLSSRHHRSERGRSSH